MGAAGSQGCHAGSRKTEDDPASATESHHRPRCHPVGLPGESVPVFGGPREREGSGMCIPGLRGDAAAGTDPARLAFPRKATSPGNVTCPPWGQQRSLHPLSPGVGQEQPGWKRTLWSCAFPGGAPSSPRWGGEQDRGSPGRIRDPPLLPRPKTEVKHRTRLKAVHEGARFG